MIATNETTGTHALPAVLFPVAWAGEEWGRISTLLERVQSSVSYHWRHIAPVVELARTIGGGGVLRVTLDPESGVSVVGRDGRTFMVANARAVWMAEIPSPAACAALGADASAELHTPPTRRGVTVVAAVLADDESPASCTLVGRVQAEEPHAEWLAQKMARSPGCAEKLLWIVSVPAGDFAGLVEELAT